MALRKLKSGFRQAGAFVSKQNHIDLLPIRHALKGYSKGHFKQDSLSGLNVALLAFPQGMAYALIAGLPIQYGILSFVAASLIASLFSSSRFNSYGPSNATAVLILSTFLGLQLPEEITPIALPALVLLTGIFLIIGSYLRLAKIVQYISKTVITGYITGAALLIIANQVKNALGFDIPQASSFFGVVQGTLSQLPTTHLPSLILSLTTAAIYFALVRHFRSLPNVAITLVCMGIVSTLMAHIGYPVETLQAINLADWNPVAFPSQFELWNQLLLPALALAFLITLESCSIGKSLAARSGDRLNTNQEMFGLGVGNIASACLGGMAASASLTRSSLNCNGRAATALSNFFSALVVLTLFFTLGHFIQYIPKPALAVLVISIGLTLINRHNIRIVSRSTRSDTIVFFTTVFVGLVFALDTAIYIGTILSIALFLRKVAEPEMVEYDFNQEGQLAAIDQSKHSRTNPEVSIVHVEGELFFGATDVFHDQIRRVCDDPNLKIVILKMRNAHHLDASSVMAFEELVRYMNEKSRFLLISEARKDIIKILKRSGVFDVLNRENIFPDSPSNPTLSTAKALKRAKEILGSEVANVSIYVDQKRDQQKRAERLAQAADQANVEQAEASQEETK